MVIKFCISCMCKGESYGTLDFAKLDDVPEPQRATGGYVTPEQGTWRYLVDPDYEKDTP